MQNVKQREYFRLAYPQVHRPKLLMEDEGYEVEDVSEYGVKVKIDSDLAFMIHDHVMATIEFPDGREFDLSASVVRIDHEYAGLQLETPLPNSLIRSEALNVMYNFPEQSG